MPRRRLVLSFCHNVSLRADPYHGLSLLVPPSMSLGSSRSIPFVSVLATSAWQCPHAGLIWKESNFKWLSVRTRRFGVSDELVCFCFGFASVLYNMRTNSMMAACSVNKKSLNARSSPFLRSIPLIKSVIDHLIVLHALWSSIVNQRHGQIC